MSSLKEQFEKEIIPTLMNDLKITNRFAVPRLQKVVVNAGIGQNKVNPKFKEMVEANLISITGQKPNVRRARKAISGFKVRTGDEVGLTVTLRGAKMYDFVQKTANITLPRLRDFKGIDPKSFDGAGNITVGFKEQVIFPEIMTENSENIHGLEVSFIINSNSPENSRRLMELFGFPFKKEQNG